VRSDKGLFGAISDPRLGWPAYLIALAIGMLTGALALLLLVAVA
jgi:hypothetical protein